MMRLSDSKLPPVSRWCPLTDTLKRSLGMESCCIFRDKANASKLLVERLELKMKLDFHDGCVNSLNFNEGGDLIASGSDDCNIAIWNWAKNSKEPQLWYDSGHNSNVFQAKFMPNSNNMTTVSCARDGQIRVAFLSLANQVQQTKRIAQHRGSAHKLSIEPGSPHIFLTCGEDAVVYSIDLREAKPQKLFCLHNEKHRKVPLYSIFMNPTNMNEFAVGGRDQFARVFDRRKILEEKESGILKKFCPDHLKEQPAMHANITCLVYNYDGTEILTSYNDEDIYLFDSTLSSEANHIHCYKGHRNSATVKGVNMLGPKSEYVISGSDCGHIFIWNKSTEEVVNFLPGDRTGVVNVLEQHPSACILATSGLDHDVKLWTPTGKTTDLAGLASQMKANDDERHSEPEFFSGPFDERLLLMMVRRFRRRQIRERLGEDDNESDSSDDDDDDDDDDEQGLSDSDSDSEEEPTTVQCAPS